ncbi:MAG: hypothetical protein J0M10_15925 [Chitinophagales bacterium]|nr:hypothetical protein [Chitinophagales bacterium]
MQFSVLVFSQQKTEEWKMYNVQNGDTSLYCKIVKEGKYYSFNFEQSYFLNIKIDSAVNRQDTIKEVSSYSYGPYAFYKDVNGITYTVKGMNPVKRLLYSFSDIKKPTALLFSDAYTASSEYTWLINKEVVLYQYGKLIKCYLFKSEAIQSPDSYYSLYYVDKKQFLPFKIETYRLDNNQAKLINQLIIAR